MNKQSKIKFASISKEQTLELTTITKEIIAVEFLPAKSFNIVDLWNLQRKTKTSKNRRHLV